MQHENLYSSLTQKQADQHLCMINTQWFEMKLDFSEIMLVRGTVQIMLMTIILVTNGYSILPKIGDKNLKVRLLAIIQGKKEI